MGFEKIIFLGFFFDPFRKELLNLYESMHLLEICFVFILSTFHNDKIVFIKFFEIFLIFEVVFCVPRFCLSREVYMSSWVEGIFFSVWVEYFADTC